MTADFVYKTGRAIQNISAHADAIGVKFPDILTGRRPAGIWTGYDPFPPPALASLDTALAIALRRTGVFVTDARTLGLAGPGFDKMMGDATRLAGALARRKETLTASPPPALIRSRQSDMVLFPDIFRWGLNPVLLGIAEAYLGGPVAYDGPIVFHTPADPREIATRRWHIDREDPRVFKVAVYLCDVDESRGPLQLFRPPADGSCPMPDFRSFDMAGLTTTYGADLVSRRVETCIGAAGSVIFADTGRCYHRCKPVTGRARSAMFFTYFPRWPLRPIACGRSGLSRAQIAGVVADLSKAQRASALWWGPPPQH